jgi:hypothetical protein
LGKLWAAAIGLVLNGVKPFPATPANTVGGVDKIAFWDETGKHCVGTKYDPASGRSRVSARVLAVSSYQLVRRALRLRNSSASADFASIQAGLKKTMPTKVFIGCIWAVGLALLLVVLGSREEESSIKIWMWTAGITGLCWLIAKVIRDRADDSD